jgi:hypothetical protein
MAQMNFSTQGIDTTSTYEALPPGEYTVVVSDSQMKQTASGTGHYLALTLQVQGPEQHRGRMLWDNLNISNPSAKAVEIAQRQLAQLVKACGLRGNLGQRAAAQHSRSWRSSRSTGTTRPGT